MIIDTNHRLRDQRSKLAMIKATHDIERGTVDKVYGTEREGIHHRHDKGRGGRKALITQRLWCIFYSCRMVLRLVVIIT